VPSTYNLSNRRIDEILPLTSPADLMASLPLSDEGARTVLLGRTAACEILDGADDRLLVIVGPCSIHDVDAAMDYARRLAGAARDHARDLLVVMRAYPEKPRTHYDWKGLLTDPHLDDSGDVNTGLRLVRQLLLDILGLGLPVACEFLDPITPQYMADAVSWAAIGARTVESQVHRQLASGLSMPVGFKNRGDGDVEVAVDALRSARHPHAFMGIDSAGEPAILRTSGNHDCHVVLRGGRAIPNYEASHVEAACGLLRAARLRERVVVDASHENSGKDHERQPLVAADVGAQVAAGSRAVVGVMLESFLVAGKQDRQAPELVHGQSITDACMSWETTAEVLDGLAASVRARRASAAAA
jgi:3-deoxy-7-phosphoheptulonate synthase